MSRREATATMVGLVTEKDFSATVLRLARLRGWLTYHTHDSRRSEPGFPDWCFVRPPRIVYAELKTERGRISDAQSDWLCRLNECGGELVEARLWRPSSWDEIEAVLA